MSVARTKAQASWDVTLSHPDPTGFVGTSELSARGDTVDLTRFHDLVCDIAAGLKSAGDADPLGTRKAKALGVIADLANGQATLDLHAATGPAPKHAGKVTAYVHVDAADLDLDGEGGSAFAVGYVERLGPATLTKIKDWIGRHRVTIQPVLNLQRTDAVDVHDPPAWMRELMILRDKTCVFPGCTRDARFCDLDHITPYDPNGPPGQTRPENLACLCRRHHRAKTSGAWRYWRTPEGDCHWHGPYGATYLVTPRGTHRLP